MSQREQQTGSDIEQDLRTALDLKSAMRYLVLMLPSDGLPNTPETTCEGAGRTPEAEPLFNLFTAEERESMLDHEQWLRDLDDLPF